MRKTTLFSCSERHWKAEVLRLQEKYVGKSCSDSLMDWSVCLSLFVVVPPPRFSFPKTLVIYRNSPSPLIWHSVLYLCQWAGTRLWLWHSAHIQTQIWHIWHRHRHDIIEKIPFFPPICPNHPEIRPLLSFHRNYSEAKLPWAKIVGLLRSRIVDAECREARVFIQGV